MGLLAPVALLGLAACDAESWLALHETASFRTLAPAEARALIAHEGAQLIQVGPNRHQATPAGAQRVSVDWVWPEELAQAPSVVILAEQPDADLRLAARMARAGIQGVVVVSGGLEAWNAERSLAAAGTDTRTE